MARKLPIMKKTKHHGLFSERRRQRGYTLIEVLVASGILMVAVSAAASLSLSMSAQEEINFYTSRALNLQENYVRAYHLGLEPATIQAIMPPENALQTINTANADAAVAGVGDMESVTWEFIIRPNPNAGTPTAGVFTGGDGGALRTVNVRAFRSSQY